MFTDNVSFFQGKPGKEGAPGAKGDRGDAVSSSDLSINLSCNDYRCRDSEIRSSLYQKDW